MYLDVVSYVKSWILRRNCELKSHVVVRRLRYIDGKVGEKHGVMLIVTQAARVVTSTRQFIRRFESLQRYYNMQLVAGGLCYYFVEYSSTNFTQNTEQSWTKEQFRQWPDKWRTAGPANTFG